MKTFEPLPDILHPTAHMDVSPQVDKNWYRTRRYAANVTPFELVVNFIRHELGRGETADHLLNSADFSSRCAYWSVSVGPTCSGLKRGKIKGWVYGKKEEVFSLFKILEEIRITKNQRKLL